MTKYYELFVNDIVKRLKLNEEEEHQFRNICKLYGADWKLSPTQ